MGPAKYTPKASQPQIPHPHPLAVTSEREEEDFRGARGGRAEDLAVGVHDGNRARGLGWRAGEQLRIRGLGNCRQWEPSCGLQSAWTGTSSIADGSFNVRNFVLLICVMRIGWSL